MIYWHFRNNNKAKIISSHINFIYWQTYQRVIIVKHHSSIRPSVCLKWRWLKHKTWMRMFSVLCCRPPSPIATNCHRLLPECLFTWVHHHHIVLYTTCIQLTLPHQLEWRSRTVSQWYSDNDVIVSKLARWARNV